MASPQSPDASEIRRRGRQRLIGAVAIALLLIVFVPMLLDSEPRAPRQEPKLDIPAKETAPPLPAPRPAEGTAAKVEAPKAEAPKAEAPAAPATPPPPAAKVAVVEPKTAEKAAPKGPSAKDKFAIQVGAFKDEEKLQQAREKLSAANIQSYTEPSGSLTRLRVGPFPTREAAEKTAAAVRKAVPDAKVVPLQ